MYENFIFDMKIVDATACRNLTKTHPALQIFWGLPKDCTFYNETTTAGEVAPYQKIFVAVTNGFIS